MLKDKRKAAHITQEELSARSGISVRTIQHYEQGTLDIDNSTLKTFVALALVLDCPIRDLLTDKKLLADVKKVRL